MLASGLEMMRPVGARVGSNPTLGYATPRRWITRFADAFHWQPILVAAAIDYEIKNGNEYGALARLISNEIRDQRRIELGLDPPPSELTPPGPPRPADWKQQREMAGGTIVIGRHTLKEYMSGLSRGWTRPLEKEDEDTVVARELENDGHFDEPATTLETVMEEADPSLSDPTFSTTPSKPPQLIYSPMQLKMPTPSKPSPPPQAAPIPPELNAPPSEIPLQPPLTLVPYTSLLGFLNIPFMIVGYFNKRKDVLMGAEAAYRAIVNQTRPFEGPSPDSKGDLSFDAHAEVNYRKDFNNIPKNVTSARKSYYDALPKKLEIARALARNEREPTKDEKKYPPPTEVELRAERLKKEKRWRNELDGFEILNREVGVAWDERMRDALTVTVDGELPPPPPPPFQSYDP